MVYIVQLSGHRAYNSVNYKMFHLSAYTSSVKSNSTVLLWIQTERNSQKICEKRFSKLNRWTELPSHSWNCSEFEICRIFPGENESLKWNGKRTSEMFRNWIKRSVIEFINTTLFRYVQQSKWPKSCILSEVWRGSTTFLFFAQPSV